MRVWIAFASVLIVPLAWAQFTVPSLSGPVVDEGQMLSPSTQARLSEFLRRLHESGGTQLQVATVPNLGGLSIEEASIKITDQWKLGSAKEDNGVLLLVAAQERKVRIEVGQGREGVLPDVIASRIIREVIVPRFKQGQIDRGVTEGVLAIVHYTDPEFLEQTGQTGGVPSGRGWLNFLILLFLFTFVFLPALFGRHRGRRSALWGLPGIHTGSGWGSGGGGFGGGGGWGGGGGGFSGGGASGDW